MVYYNQEKGKTEREVRIMTEYRVCGITTDGKMTKWEICKSRDEQIARANALLNTEGIVAIQTYSITKL